MEYFSAMASTKEQSKEATPAPAVTASKPPNSVDSDSGGDDHPEKNMSAPSDGVELDDEGTPEVPKPPFIGNEGDAVIPRFIKKKLLGQGAYGEAWLCRRTATDELAVVKLMSLPNMSFKEKTYAESEVQCLATVDHPNVIKFQDSYSDGKTLCIAMEYANGGDLRRHIKSRAQQKNYLHESEAMFIFLQVAMAIQHIHAKSMLHRDIKSANVLIASNGLVKVADFGFSRQYEDTVSNEVAKTFCGTPYYLAPELWRSRRYSNKAEVWSLGVFLYELLALHRPFTSSSLKGLMEEVLLGSYRPLNERYSHGANDLVAALLDISPKTRPTVFDIFRYSYVQSLTRMLISLVNNNKEISTECRDEWTQSAEELLAKAEEAGLIPLPSETSASNSESTTLGSSADASTSVGTNPTAKPTEKEGGAVDGTVTHSGVVKKLTTYSSQKWPDRHLKLANGVLELSEDGQKHAKQLQIDVLQSVTSITPAAAKRRHVFAIHTRDARCTWLQAPSEYEKKQWISKLQQAMGCL